MGKDNHRAMADDSFISCSKLLVSAEAESYSTLSPENFFLLASKVLGAQELSAMSD